jgi:hypothetical protein
MPLDSPDRFDIAFACDTDHDRHGVVTRNAGLLPPNHYLAVAIFYLFQHRPTWRTETAVGKTVVSSQMIDRVTAKLGRKTSTRSMRRASVEEIICAVSCRKRRQTSTMLWLQRHSGQGLQAIQM